jgi:glycosyltransferase involved in cell wall biosynthesis
MSYPEIRNITSLNLDRVSYEVVPSDFSKEPAVQAQRERSSLFSEYVTCPVSEQRIDCYHYFNSIPLNGVPFVCTFESTVPRWWGVDDDTWQRGIDILCSDSCRKLFAISRNAGELMRSFLSKYSTNVANQIMGKVEALYPPQAIHAAANSGKFNSDGPLKIAFVGADFYRKGGYEFVCAIDDLLAFGLDLHVQIVSNLTPRQEDYPWNQDAEARANHTREILHRYPDRIMFHSGMTASEVWDAFANSHLAVLPSFHDTFGFSVLEAQSALCPVITTNQRAFPEINDDEIGWIVALPVDNFNQVSLRPEAFPGLSRTLQEKLYHLILSIVNTPRIQIREKAERARERIRQTNDPTAVASRLYSLY